ncbi:transposon protein, putative, CACTA, En/Spm sub-class [Panicum miliaceum]|uniref:Transposon protein, putative, CACTA, En/Spm sub-class n=1 Tax=Panicum miliaceum TaxID=4540 RepID=A0A3L6RVD0_PANMI|nr:transposon protein, putative, CACTA, En/Spm sub-class [Panicum miliaceum]
MPQGEEFPHLHDYGTYLRGNSEEGAGHDWGSGLLPPRAPRSLGVPNQRAGGGAGWAARGAALHARQLNFGASSSVAGSRGGHDDAMPSWPAHGGGNNGIFIGGSSSGAGSGGGGDRGRANSSSRAPGRRRQRANASNRGGACGRGGRGGRAARSAGPPQATGSDYIDVDEEGACEEEVEDLGSSGGPPVHPNLENPDFWPHFNNCIEAIDGTHVKVVVPKSKRIQYLNRHNETTQNVLAVCDFDIKFTFVLSGWPVLVHDMRVFKDVMTTHVHKFPHPPQGKYYVVDAGYPNRPGYLSPYRCTRYHVEQWQNGAPPQGANPGVPEDLRTRSWRHISRECDHVRAWRSSIGSVKQKGNGNRAAEQPINNLFFLANHS